MFCWQCEQTKLGQGCDSVGDCGKTGEAASLQDLLLHSLKGLGQACSLAREKGTIDRSIDRFTLKALFAALTNVEFDPESLASLAKKAVLFRDALTVGLGGAKAEWDLSIKDFDDGGSLSKTGERFGIRDISDPVLLSMRETCLYGLKGLAAYAYHASKLGQEDDSLFSFISEVLGKSLDESLGLGDWLDLSMKAGEMNLLAMRLLYEGNSYAFGDPEPGEVALGHKKGPAVLVSGHDLKDLHELLLEIEGKGINAYTHGEMLPARSYPGLKKFSCLCGHFGTGWQNQQKELAFFPGPVLFTSNCIQKPTEDRLKTTFVSGPAGWPGTNKVKEDEGGKKSFRDFIEMAKSMGGFQEDEDRGRASAGFGHKAMLRLAPQLIEAVKAGKIRRFILVGGCDGAKGARSYYRDIAALAPKDAIILTLGCGKFRFFDMDLGKIDGLPRLMDMGQRNDAYSAIQAALALCEAFGANLSELPLSLVLSWYEQKAVSILLSLFSLGIKNIKLGPSLPAFIHPEILKVLVEKFGVSPIKDPKEDLLEIMG
jgi:hydroxylamine reductase